MLLVYSLIFRYYLRKFISTLCIFVSDFNSYLVRKISRPSHSTYKYIQLHCWLLQYSTNNVMKYGKFVFSRVGLPIYLHIPCRWSFRNDGFMSLFLFLAALWEAARYNLHLHQFVWYFNFECRKFQGSLYCMNTAKYEICLIIPDRRKERIRIFQPAF